MKKMLAYNHVCSTERCCADLRKRLGTAVRSSGLATQPAVWSSCTARSYIHIALKCASTSHHLKVYFLVFIILLSMRVSNPKV